MRLVVSPALLGDLYCFIKEKQEEIRGRDYPDVPDGYCCVHIYFGNPFPETVSKMIFKKAARVAWVGDYADNAEKYGCLYQKKKEDYPERPRRFTKKIYKDVWRKKGKESLPIISCSDSDQPGFSIAGKYLVNHSRREYLDCSAYEKRSRCKEQCIHPLPLLTAARNGMGSGDYRSEGLPCKKEVGRWCLDLISVEEEPPAGFACIDVTFREPG